MTKIILLMNKAYWKNMEILIRKYKPQIIFSGLMVMLFRCIFDFKRENV